MSSPDKISLPDFLKQLTSNNISHSKAIHVASKMSVLTLQIVDFLAVMLTHGEDIRPITPQLHWPDLLILPSSRLGSRRGTRDG